MPVSRANGYCIHCGKPVIEFPFELRRAMPEPPKPLLEQIGELYLRSLVVREPNATLSKYVRIIQRERGVGRISDQTMCKLFKKIDVMSKRRR